MSNKRQNENKRVKDAIMFAFFELLKEMPISKISISEVVKRAHVARKSYYRNFEKKEDVLQYFYDKVIDEAIVMLEEKNITSLNDEFITEVFVILKKYGYVFMTLHSKGYTAFGMELMNTFLGLTIGYMPTSSIQKYWLYLLGGAFYNASIKWLQDGAKEAPEKMAALIGDFRVSLINQYNETVGADG